MTTEPTTPAFAPTDEQAHAIELFTAGLGLALEAGAGTGKTATLEMLGRSTQRRGQYVAFNKAIVEDSARKMPRNVAANTAHSLAFRGVGRRFAHRLNTGRVKSNELARQLKVDPIYLDVDGKRKVMQPGYLASHVMRAVSRFCQSADAEPSRRHVGYIDGIDHADANGRRTYANNDLVAAALEPIVRRAWSDLSSVDGTLPYQHEHYLKFFERNDPRIGADFVLLDEAQDVSPVMLSCVTQQAHAQLVFVGDSQQEIYAWMGAVNAMQTVPHDARSFLTKSFRFGPAIADVANLILDRLDAELRLTGNEALTSSLGWLDKPDAILCRTNARAVSTVLGLQRTGVSAHLVGGGGEVAAFARAAADLMAGVGTHYHDLACFSTWGEVQEYVENDPQGSDLKLLVELIDEYTVDVILGALDNMATEANAAVVVSTAHKSKGREWARVQLASDFPNPFERGDADSEWRLLYVAATRAREVLDVTCCDPIADLLADRDVVAAAESALTDAG